jgi:hypothetical protein
MSTLWKRAAEFFEETRAQAIAEYVLIFWALILFALLINTFVDSTYGLYVSGIYYVLSLPVP